MRLSKLLFACCLTIAAGAPAQAENLVGDWVTEDGARITIARCGEAYCSTVASGEFKGRRIARVVGPGPTFEGKILDPRQGKTYTGSMSVAGNELDLKGCLLEVFCKSVQTWTRR